MKAILKINQFTTMIDIPKRLPLLYISAPTSKRLNSVASQFFEELSKVANTPSVKKWEFEFKKMIMDDIALYEFVGESCTTHHLN